MSQDTERDPFPPDPEFERELEEAREQLAKEQVDSTEEIDYYDMFPHDEKAREHVGTRLRIGNAWSYALLGATAAAIVVLIVLLLNILNQSMGLVAEQTAIPEVEIVTLYNAQTVAESPNVAISSEDDAALATGVASDPNGIGFFGIAFYSQLADELRLVPIDGVAPNEQTAADGEYRGTRPLFLYTSREIVDDKPQVGAFLAYYLQNLDEVMAEVGYFPADQELLDQQEAAILEALQLETLPDINPADFEGDIAISGSSTIYPVTRQMAINFRRAGFPGAIRIENTGTGAGFTSFCSAEPVDIVDASRPATQLESEKCLVNGRPLTELLIGTDALAIVVSAENTFVDEMTHEQVEEAFTRATTWSEVNAEWPDEPIRTYVPTTDSGTMDFFVQSMFVEQSLADLPYDSLVGIFTLGVSAGRCRAVESEQRFYADRLVCDTEESYQARCDSASPPAGCTAEPRDAANVENLIQAEIVRPEVLQSWFLFPSIFNRDEITAEAAVKYPNAELRFKRWWTIEFLLTPQASVPELAGVRTAILGSLWVVAIAVLFGFPLGVGAALYLEEYADRTTRFNKIIQTNINNLAGVPSIIYGLLGLAVFVRALEPLTSGCALGFTDCSTANGRTILSAGLTLGLLILPVIIISAQEAIRAVPPSLREASFGVGATKWQTVWNHVLPNALPGILTGVILAMSRAIGETAPLVVVGASTFITTDPTGPFSKFTTLPSQIYQWTTRPQATFLNIAAAAIIVLLVLLFILNATAIFLRNRYSKRTV